MENVKMKVINKHEKKFFKQRIKNFLVNLKTFILNIEIDTFFLFLASYLVINFPLGYRIMVSIGVMYLYKMFVKDIMQMILISKRK